MYIVSDQLAGSEENNLQKTCRSQGRKGTTVMKRILMIILDLLISTALLGGIYGINYLIPQSGVMAKNISETISGKPAAAAGSSRRK